MPIISGAGSSQIGGVVVTGTPSATNVLTATSATAADWEAVPGTSVSSGGATSDQVLKATGSGGAAFARSGYALVSSGTLGSANATLFDISGITSVYSALSLMVSARGDNASQSISAVFRINNDSGANYDYNAFFDNGAGPTLSSNNLAGQTSVLVTFPANTATAGSAGVYSLWLPFYAGTTLWKQGEMGGSSSDGAGVYNLFQTTFRWKNTAAITRLALTTGGAGNFVTGSSFALWGAA